MAQADAATTVIALSQVDRSDKRRDAMSAGAVWLRVALVVALTWPISRSGLYKSGDDVGYYLGLAGALLMAALLLYPLRKRVRILARLGALRHWFRLHMFLGLSGPILILLHSNYELGSLNAAVAFWTMVLVSGSGIFGRFFYTKIHHGLYGRQTTLAEVRTRFDIQEGATKARFFYAPRVEQRLRSFEASALAPARNPLSGTVRFLTLTPRAFARWLLCRHEIDERLRERADARGWPAEKLVRRRRRDAALMHDYLRAVVDVAQFAVYERLFSWWHVAHVPLVYILVLSVVVHVIAVHMY